MVFKRQAAKAVPDSPLEGVTWSGNTFLSGEMASSLVAGTSVTIKLENGKEDALRESQILSIGYLYCDYDVMRDGALNHP